jgi:hypothetical protein
MNHDGLIVMMAMLITSYNMVKAQITDANVSRKSRRKRSGGSVMIELRASWRNCIWIMDDFRHALSVKRLQSLAFRGFFQYMQGPIFHHLRQTESNPWCVLLLSNFCF